MRTLKSVLTQKNIGAGYLYFYIHFVVEVICFYTLAKLLGNSIFLWIAPFMYDAFAFVPQSLIGYISDKYPKINIGIIGTILLLIGLITCNLHILGYIPLIILCLGNACLHISGTETTLRASDGKLSHSAIFVAGGSFGVITGKLLGTLNFSYLFLVLLGLTMIPFILLADEYRKEADKQKQPCKNFNYINKKINPFIIILLAVFVVIVRGYMGYGIPTSWNKTVFQTILLYFAMGTGKALGGILSDWIGIRKTAVISILLALPFLLFGDDLMLISLIGVLMFSMTMSITLAILVSVLKNKPGLAFGLTTIGLFLGTVPIFFIKLSKLYNCIVIGVFSIICIIIMLNILRKDEVK